MSKKKTTLHDLHPIEHNIITQYMDCEDMLKNKEYTQLRYYLRNSKNEICPKNTLDYIISDGDDDIIKLFIFKHYKFSRKFLFEQVRKNNVKVFEKLLKLNIDVNRIIPIDDQYELFKIAVMYNNIKLVKLFLKMNIHMDYSVVESTALFKSFDILEYFINININMEKMIKYAINYERVDVIYKIISTDNCKNIKRYLKLYLIFYNKLMYKRLHDPNFNFNFFFGKCKFTDTDIDDALSVFKDINVLHDCLKAMIKRGAKVSKNTLYSILFKLDESIIKLLFDTNPLELENEIKHKIEQTEDIFVLDLICPYTSKKKLYSYFKETKSKNIKLYLKKYLNLIDKVE